MTIKIEDISIGDTFEDENGFEGVVLGVATCRTEESIAVQYDDGSVGVTGPSRIHTYTPHFLLKGAGGVQSLPDGEYSISHKVGIGWTQQLHATNKQEAESIIKIGLKLLQFFEEKEKNEK